MPDLNGAITEAHQPRRITTLLVGSRNDPVMDVLRLLVQSYGRIADAVFVWRAARSEDYLNLV